MFIRCRSCRRPLSVSLAREVDARATNQADGQAFLLAGSLHRSDGEFFTGTEGRYIINLADAMNVRDHADTRRLAGCCGLDGCDGPNQVCACGVEVATAKSDCWMPHALIFECEAVELVDETG